MDEELVLRRTNIEIDDTELSIRSSNLLRDNEIKYLNQLTEFTTRTLLGWRGMGKKNIKRKCG